MTSTTLPTFVEFPIYVRHTGEHGPVEIGRILLATRESGVRTDMPVHQIIITSEGRSIEGSIASSDIHDLVSMYLTDDEEACREDKPEGAWSLDEIELEDEHAKRWLHVPYSQRPNAHAHHPYMTREEALIKEVQELKALVGKLLGDNA